MKPLYYKIIFISVLLFNILSCKKNAKTVNLTDNDIDTIQIDTPANMVWIPAKTFLQGAKPNDVYAMPREKPAHEVTVSGFFMDITEVTNKQFKAFVDATNYITVAEREIDWEEMQKELPVGTPKPHDSIFKPGSLIFNKNVEAVVNMENYAQWWTWKIGANWKQPQGPGSSIEGQDNFPVVHVALEDALSYCKWANRRLPTESEWESAAQGTNNNAIFTWGNNPEFLNTKANTWQGVFPTKNESIDGYKYIAPVKSFEPNSMGLYDMSGNVWEITSDFFNINYYKELDKNKPLINPKGANKTFTPSNPYGTEYVIKGGSFLCHASYCASFRISAKMGMAPDSGSDHAGFRTVVTKKMLSAKN